MSKEDVVRFMQKVQADPSLARKITGAARTASAWVEKGNEAGFHFSSDELRAVSEELLGRRLAGDAFVADLLAAPTGKGELDAGSLDRVTGGAGAGVPVFSTNLASRLGSLGGVQSSLYLKISDKGGSGGAFE